MLSSDGKKLTVTEEWLQHLQSSHVGDLKKSKGQEGSASECTSGSGSGSVLKSGGPVLNWLYGSGHVPPDKPSLPGKFTGP